MTIRLPTIVFAVLVQGIISEAIATNPPDLRTKPAGSGRTELVTTIVRWNTEQPLGGVTVSCSGCEPRQDASNDKGTWTSKTTRNAVNIRFSKRDYLDREIQIVVIKQDGVQTIPTVSLFPASAIGSTNEDAAYLREAARIAAREQRYHELVLNLNEALTRTQATNMSAVDQLKSYLALSALSDERVRDALDSDPAVAKALEAKTTKGPPINAIIAATGEGRVPLDAYISAMGSNEPNVLKRSIFKSRSDEKNLSEAIFNLLAAYDAPKVAMPTTCPKGQTIVDETCVNNKLASYLSCLRTVSGAEVLVSSGGSCSSKRKGACGVVQVVPFSPRHGKDSVSIRLYQVTLENEDLDSITRLSQAVPDAGAYCAELAKAAYQNEGKR